MTDCFAWTIKVLIICLVQSGGVEGLKCYRCDSVNEGDTCEGRPASRHIRSYGDEEPCLFFEEANKQYLALQRELDMEWYLSVLNGDHGIPIQLLRTTLLGNGSSFGHGYSPFLYADRDVGCLYVRSVFHHNMDEDDTLRAHPNFVLWFRKCVQLPAFEAYPVCGKANIYKGQIELCVCRDDRCNLDLETIMEKRTIIVEHSLTVSSVQKTLGLWHWLILPLIKVLSF